MSERPARTHWLLVAAALVTTTVLALQHTKQAFLPAKQTPIVWIAEALVVVGLLVLRSGWGRDGAWMEAQGELGTLANNYYEPRREWLIHGYAVGFGVFGGLWWAIATWGVMFTGLRRHVAGRGMLDFEIAALMGAVTGGVVGAVVGLAIGHVWETRHRQRRLERGANRA